jgi:hypothetical protein
VSQPNQQQQGGQAGQPHQQQNGQMAQFAQMMQQMQQQQQAMMEKMMQAQQDSESDRLKEELAELKSELRSDDGGGSMTDEIKEVVELKELLDNLGGDDDQRGQTEEVVGALQQQIQALRQEVAQSDDGAQMGELMTQTDSQFGLLAALAQSGNVDTSEVAELAQQLGQVESDPAVAEKKYEKEIEEMKMNAEKEKWESIINGAEDVVQNAFSVLGGADGGGGDDSQQRDARAESAETTVGSQQTQQPQTATESRGEQSATNQQSPAQQIVQQNAASEPEEAEPEIVEAEEPDADPELENGTSPKPDDLEPTDEPAQEVEEEEPPTPDGGGVNCPGCGKGFDNERQLRGHKGHCDEWED